jgi:Zn finger protein HypA/HybF involved in hydrogenase expression|tara:strand:- start:60 stop:299 length:240 start_codon:yes stop_codon:yes gene_type:complete
MSKKNKIRFTAEVVNGKCSTCEEFTALVAIERDFFRCMNCGADLEQHINGKISYLPVIQAPKGAKPFVREWLEDDGEKV